MKSITNYIFEKIKDLPDSVKGLIVFDIDDILSVSEIYCLSDFILNNTINLYKNKND